jgi:hypothetical protein
MGYVNSATTTTLTAKLTPLGRRKLILTNNNLITSFSLGDSDANYNATLPLTTGQVPADGGSIGPYNSTTNSVGPNVKIETVLTVNNTGALTKPVEPESSQLTTEYIAIGQTAITGAANIKSNLVNRNNINTDPLVNLYHSFNLPLNTSDDYKFTGLTAAQGGYLDTAYSGLAQSQIAVIAIGNSQYGELIDGKSLKIDITTATLSLTYTIYATYENTGVSLANQDASYYDDSSNAKIFGENIAFLVSDDIQKPNGGDTTLSWATGFGTAKPYSLNNKQLFNFNTNTNLSLYADKLVGIAYLDRGFAVITHPDIVFWFNFANTSASTVTLDSVSSQIIQNVTCIANRGEFGVSTNTTFKVTDTPRISEVGLYDMDNDLIAIAKLDRHLLKNVNEFLALGVKISI